MADPEGPTQNAGHPVDRACTGDQLQSKNGATAPVAMRQQRGKSGRNERRSVKEPAGRRSGVHREVGCVEQAQSADQRRSVLELGQLDQRKDRPFAAAEPVEEPLLQFASDHQKALPDHVEGQDAVQG